MVRKAEATSITPKMYRHFAAVTLAATVGLAMFANGETREAVAREVEQAGKPPAQAGPNDFVRKEAPSQGSFGTDDWVDAGFGQPTDRGGAAVHSGVIPGEPAAPPQAGMPVGYTLYGVSAQAWELLSDEQKKKLIADRQAAQAAAAKPERAQEIDALLAASRARSGITAAVPD